MMRKLLAMTFVSLIALAYGAPAMSSPAAIMTESAVEMPAEQVTVLFVNATKSYLTFYVDGKRVAACPPGDQASILVEPGTHTLEASTPDNRRARHSGRIGSEGLTWTISGG
jgi:hypothetical protein